MQDAHEFLLFFFHWIEEDEIWKLKTMNPEVDLSELSLVIHRMFTGVI